VVLIKPLFEGKKNPSTWAGVVSLFAVNQQGPAQGGEAGGAETPSEILAEISQKHAKWLLNVNNSFYA
jgi:hypothetical protein